MTLRIRRIELDHFRNQERFTLEPSETLTIITGPNAAGKTNLIEAIQLVTAAESFRGPSWSELIAWGADRTRVSMRAEGDDRVRDVTLEVGEDGKRIYRVNGNVKRRLADVAGALPAVLFTPDDLGMVKGTAERRRQALDEIGQQLSHTYREIRADFERALRQRNALLREENADAELLDAWTGRLAELGAALAVHRMRLFERMAPLASAAYADISSGESLEVRYVSAWWTAETSPADRGAAQVALRQAIEARQADEVARRQTLAGPHRDDVLFLVGGQDARAFASQGQQRSVALAWKLAELASVERVAGVEPVLLLDDVMSELDEARRHALAEAVRGRAQTFVTTTNLGYFDTELVQRAEVVDLGGA